MTVFPPVVEVRPAVPEDAEVVARIWNTTLPTGLLGFSREQKTPESAREFLGEQDERHPILVAVAEEGVVGWAKLSRLGTKPWHSGLGEVSICVDERLRGRGVGRTLLASLYEEATRRDYWKLIGMIFSHNAASRRLFVACGFRELGVFERHGQLGDSWIDVVLYERLLGRAL